MWSAAYCVVVGGGWNVERGVGSVVGGGGGGGGRWGGGRGRGRREGC